MNERRTDWRWVMLAEAVFFAGLMLLTGCRAKDYLRESSLYQKVYRRSHFDPPARPAPGRLAATGSEAITAECAHEPFTNARKGLIIGEAGLHEDVFTLRDRNSLAAIPYGVNEAKRLEMLLHDEAGSLGRSTAQADCIDEFAEHFERLTDTLLQNDKLQQEMDISAFNDAKRQADRGVEEKRREILQSAPADPH